MLSLFSVSGCLNKRGTTEGEPIRYRGKVSGQGIYPKRGTDFIEIFSHVVKFNVIRVMMSVVIKFGV